MAESWRNRKTLILGRSDMVGLLTPAEYVDCVEHAFRMHGLGRVYTHPQTGFPLAICDGSYHTLMRTGASAALGADLAGEQELHPGLLQRGRVFVDDIRQCREDGEINVPLREGLITEDDVAGEIGKVICGELEGRQSEEQVTVFDSTGIALQDSATVPLEVERAVAAGVGIEKKMIST